MKNFESLVNRKVTENVAETNSQTAGSTQTASKDTLYVAYLRKTMIESMNYVITNGRRVSPSDCKMTLKMAKNFGVIDRKTYDAIHDVWLSEEGTLVRSVDVGFETGRYIANRSVDAENFCKVDFYSVDEFKFLRIILNGNAMFISSADGWSEKFMEKLAIRTMLFIVEELLGNYVFSDNSTIRKLILDKNESPFYRMIGTPNGRHKVLIERNKDGLLLELDPKENCDLYESRKITSEWLNGTFF